MLLTLWKLSWQIQRIIDQRLHLYVCGLSILKDNWEWWNADAKFKHANLSLRQVIGEPHPPAHPVLREPKSNPDRK